MGQIQNSSKVRIINIMNNKDFIDAYKSEEKIISDYYKFKDKNGNVFDITGIVNPLQIDNRQLMAPTDN